MGVGIKKDQGGWGGVSVCVWRRMCVGVMGEKKSVGAYKRDGKGCVCVCLGVCACVDIRQWAGRMWGV